MKLIITFGFLIVISIFSACNFQSEAAIGDNSQTTTETSNAENGKIKTPVLVELFTSEGCSDCPPADGVLARLQREQPNGDAEIIGLELHVDYWDRLGWKDPFSSSLYSERQNEYAGKFKLDSIYTPQMVVDGQRQFIGSNFEAARSAIGETAKNQKAKIEILTSAKTNTAKLKVKISDLPAHESSNVWLAIAEDNLQTKVERGENREKTLSHTSVARELRLLGNISQDDKAFEIETDYPFQTDWNGKNLKFVVFVQGKESKVIYGVNKKSVE